MWQECVNRLFYRLEVGASAALLLVVLSLLSLPASSLAQDSALQLNGYGTLGLIHSSERRSDYIPNPLRAEGPGRSGNPSFTTDSLAALQVDYQVSPRWSATVQLVLEQDFRTDVRPRLEWANLQYRASDRLDVRLGRIALNTFMVSDFRKVGYATPWVRPPAELYQLVGLTNSDGIDLTYSFNHEGTQYSSQLVYGRSSQTIHVRDSLTETSGRVDLPNLWGTFNRLERGPLTLHASYLSAKVNYAVTEELWAGYRAFGPPGDLVVVNYDASGKWSPFMAVGAAWETGDWFLQGEWGRGDTRSDFGQRAGWYFSGGMRFEDWTPYLSYARARGSEHDVEGLDPAQFAPSVRPMLEELNNFLFLLQSGTAPHQETITAGLRWDLYPGISVTGQYDRVSTRRGSIGLFRNLENTRYRPDGADVFSLAVDFLF